MTTLCHRKQMATRSPGDFIHQPDHLIFTDQLLHAIGRATLYTPGPVSHDSTTIRFYQSLPDDFVFEGLDESIGSDSVEVTNPQRYLPLLGQAAWVLYGRQKKPITVPKELPPDYQKTAERELAYYETIQRLGNNRTTTYLGVRFIRKSGRPRPYSLLVYSRTVGPYRKAHIGWASAVAGDNEMVQLLGYDPKNLGDLQARAEATPPVDPNWVSPYRIETK